DVMFGGTETVASAAVEWAMAELIEAQEDLKGYAVGLYVLEMTLANLLHCFNWELPDGMKPSEVDMDDVFGLTVPNYLRYVLYGMKPSEVDMDDVFGLTVPKATRLVAVPTPRLLCPLY
ncbi:cytochrome P450, partial [Datura stramonium]|nr:cytochrome P450 [Datura stramonium]